MHQGVEQREVGHPLDPDFDPLDPDYLADPYPFYARFRRKAPVFYAPKIDFWVVSRYEDIVGIVKDPETFSNARVQEPLHPLTPEALAGLKKGVLRDATGNWNGAVMLDAGIILASFVLLLFPREPREEVQEPVTDRASLQREPG
jgi:hypothetical protein